MECARLVGPETIELRDVPDARAPRDGVVHPTPEGLSFGEGALSETLASVLAAHEKCRTRLGETVVVLGAGSLGCRHLAVARARGATAVSQAVEMARAGGRVVLFGGLPKAFPVPALDANRIHCGERQALGSFSYHPSFHEEALKVMGEPG